MTDKWLTRGRTDRKYNLTEHSSDVSTSTCSYRQVTNLSAFPGFSFAWRFTLWYHRLRLENTRNREWQCTSTTHTVCTRNNNYSTCQRIDVEYVNNISSMRFKREFPAILSQNPICYHQQSMPLPGNSNRISCALLGEQFSTLLLAT